MTERIAWRFSSLISEEAAFLCEHLDVRALINLTLVQNQVDMPDPQIIGKTRRVVAQTPVLQGPPLLRFHCKSPDILGPAREGQAVQVQEQIQMVMIDQAICRICPFWSPRKEDRTGGFRNFLRWLRLILSPCR